MSNVQQPEMRRSGQTPLVTDSKKKLAQSGKAKEHHREHRAGPPKEQRSKYEPEPKTPHETE